MTRPQRISAHNLLEARLEAVLPWQAHEAMLPLRVGEVGILARVIRDAVGRLGLAPGGTVWALVKSVSLGEERRDLEV